MATTHPRRGAGWSLSPRAHRCLHRTAVTALTGAPS